MVNKFETLALTAIILLSLFTACNKETLKEPLTSDRLQQNEDGFYEKQITVSDDNGTYKAKLLIHSEHSEDLELMEQQVKIKPLYQIPEEGKTLEENKSIEEPRNRTEYQHRVEIEILETDLPENALGYSVEIESSASMRKMGLWLYTITAGNHQRGKVVGNGGLIRTWNYYSECDNTNIWIHHDGPYIVSGYSSRWFKKTPTAAVGFNRISVEHEGQGTNDFLVNFYTPGTCLATQNCGWSVTNDPTCGSLTENPVTNKTMQDVSVFARDELQNAVKEFTGLITKHNGSLGGLMANDSEIKEAVGLFFEKNATLFTNGFANDHTLVKEHHVKATIVLLKLFESKVSEKEEKQYFNKLQSIVKEMQGKELKAALKSLEKINLK